MNKIISFILGLLTMFIIMMSFNILFDNDDNTTQVPTVSKPVVNQNLVDKKIAIVNNDIGIYNTDINIASSLISNMPMLNGYEIVSTTYNEATSGVEDDKYAAYIIFSSNYTSSLISIATDELPTKAKVTIKINDNLSDEQFRDVVNVLFNDYLYIKDSITYIYIAYLLDIIHNSQNKVDQVIVNEKYINTVTSNVAEYSQEKIDTLKDYIENPEKTEFDINTSGLEDFLPEDIEQIKDAPKIDDETITNKITDEQQKQAQEIEGQILDNDVKIDSLDLDLSKLDTGIDVDAYKKYLNKSLITNVSNYQNLYRILASGSEGIENYITTLEQIQTGNDNKYVLEWMIKDSLIPTFDGSLTAEQKEILKVYNSYALGYARLYAAENGITIEACEPEECMDSFKLEYGTHLSEWVNDYEQQKNELAEEIIYANDVKTNIDSAKDTISATDTLYVNGLSSKPSDYVENYHNTLDYCLESKALIEDDSYIFSLACSYADITNSSLELQNKIIKHNESLDSALSKLDDYNSNLDVIEAGIADDIHLLNENIQNKLSEYDKAELEAVKNTIEQTNTTILSVVTSTNENLNDLNKFIDKTVTEIINVANNTEEAMVEYVNGMEDSQLEERTEIYDSASKYSSSNTNINENINENIGILNTFSGLLNNTRNGNEANYYLYDYFVSPMETIFQYNGKTTDINSEPEETVAPSPNETESNKMKIILVIIALILIGILSIYLISTRRTEDE